MSGLSKREVKRQIQAVIIAKLRNECLVDTDDPDFIDVAYTIQKEMAKKLERTLERYGPAHPNGERRG